MMRLLLSFLLFSSFKTSLCQDWCYASQEADITDCKGPDIWTEVNEACGGDKQSPINIMTNETYKSARPTKLKFAGYGVNVTKIRNNKRTVVIEISSGATLTWGQLSYKYKALMIDFHWGAIDTPGSEHTIDGTRHYMEMQVLHLKDNYTTIEEAAEDPTGVAILAFFFEVGESDNENYSDLIAALANVKDGDAETALAIPLNKLIHPKWKMKSYYHYEGSMTTPNCQPVIWTLFKKPIQLSQTQLDAFIQVTFAEDKNLVHNYRPVQPLNNRVVYSDSSSGAILVVSFTLILMCLSAALGCFQLQ